MVFRLAFLSILRRPLRYVLLTFLIALSAALPVFLIQLTSGLYDGLNRAVEPFPIIAGAKGSQYQLVLNTVFLRDRPIGNISYSEVDTLRETNRAQAVIPLAFGDNYRGFRIVGTEPAIFQYVQNQKKGAWLQVAEGAAFSNERDAVIGSETARLTGLKVGDTFKSVHGLAGNGAGHAHEHPYTVSGILAPVGGPYDTAILVNIADIWEAHGGGKAHGEEGHEAAEKPVRTGGIVRSQKAAQPAPALGAATEEAHEDHDHDDHDHDEHSHLAPGEKGDVTAVLIQPKGYADAMKLLSQYQRGGDVQMVFPSQSIISLYGMVGQSREFWQAVTAVLIVSAILITILVMYWSALARLPEFALLRALGAGSGIIYRVMAIEQCLVLLFGAAAGLLLGWLGSFFAAHLIAGRAAIVMSTAPEILSLLPPALILLLGTAASLIPSWLVRKKDVSRYL